MARTLGEHALSRVLEYLAANAVVLNDGHTLVALQLVQEGLQRGEKDLLAWVMDELPGRFELTVLPLPPVSPRLERGSIGYGNGK
ncbi:hypothetical protein GCM10011348_28120 [Marinobacterium nitratireducens]|uniref:Uncharacterized protein n=1 Tax=Marinobacterium nitratireducens TaxID=518897 RepID=A0A917ZKV8_9GAMM|nr:hypothetical protein [Marinobacterium nitratireducens]GGO83702.1 hypothetical protein GCM10011348_28120 [Marinobacterium nitratireducens]